MNNSLRRMLVYPVIIIAALILFAGSAMAATTFEKSYTSMGKDPVVVNGIAFEINDDLEFLATPEGAEEPVVICTLNNMETKFGTDGDNIYVERLNPYMMSNRSSEIYHYSVSKGDVEVILSADRDVALVSAIYYGNELSTGKIAVYKASLSNSSSSKTKIVTLPKYTSIQEMSSRYIYYSVGTDKMYRYDMTKKTTKKYSLYSTWITAAQKAKLS